MAGSVPLRRSLSSGPPPSALYTLSLHDALPIFPELALVEQGVDPHRLAVELVVPARGRLGRAEQEERPRRPRAGTTSSDRKSTRLNSSHMSISYAVFCLKKKKKNQTTE